MKRIAVLGSTGSIGVNTLDVALALKDSVKITALSADSSIEQLAVQAERFHPRIVAVGNGLGASRLAKRLPASTKVVYGPEGLCEIVARRDVDMVVFAISGTACLNPLIRAIEAGKEVALANKEAVVSAGAVIMPLAKRYGTRILPIDSEHSAVFQCLDGKREFLSKIILTASGGPLRNIKAAKFDALPVSSILKHPKWQMGKKISVDSATMMNKGLEVIEACHLFALTEDMVDVVVHPEAIVHSMVEFVDGSVIGQLSRPDMRLPIQYALTFPGRLKSRVAGMDFSKIDKLTFMTPDCKKFPCLNLARHAIRLGGTYPAVLNAADEEAVGFYLDGRIHLSAIPRIIEKVISRHKQGGQRSTDLGGILAAESWAKEEARSLCCH